MSNSSRDNYSRGTEKYAEKCKRSVTYPVHHETERQTRFILTAESITENDCRKWLVCRIKRLRRLQSGVLQRSKAIAQLSPHHYFLSIAEQASFWNSSSRRFTEQMVDHRASSPTSPKAPLPMTLRGSKSSTPSLDRLSRRNSVSFWACCILFSCFCCSERPSSFRDSSSFASLCFRSMCCAIRLL